MELFIFARFDPCQTRAIIFSSSVELSLISLQLLRSPVRQHEHHLSFAVGSSPMTIKSPSR